MGFWPFDGWDSHLEDHGPIMDGWRWIEVLLLFLYGFMINGGDWRRFWWKMGWNGEVQEFWNFEICSVLSQHLVDEVDPLQRKHRKIMKSWKQNLPPSCLALGLCTQSTSWPRCWPGTLQRMLTSYPVNIPWEDVDRIHWKNVKISEDGTLQGQHPMYPVNIPWDDVDLIHWKKVKF